MSDQCLRLLLAQLYTFVSMLIYCTIVGIFIFMKFHNLAQRVSFDEICNFCEILAKMGILSGSFACKSLSKAKVMGHSYELNI